MTVTDQASRLAPYVGRLLEDDYIQAEIGQALSSLRRGSRRAKQQNASEALEDRRLRRQLGEAISSLTNAGRALSEPPPRRKPIGRALVLAAAGAGVATLAWRRTRTPAES